MVNTTLKPLGDVRYAGLDVSARAGEIDFAQVRASGRTAVYIRASVATDYIDPTMDANYIAARENGLMVGFTMCSPPAPRTGPSGSALFRRDHRQPRNAASPGDGF